MRVEYLLVHSEGTDVKRLMADILNTELVYDLDLSDEEVLNLVDIKYTRVRDDRRCISGVSVDLDIPLNRAIEVTERLSESLNDSEDEGIEHVLKLYDQTMNEGNKRLTQEIFEIEMKLREAISLILIDTYCPDFYDLFKDINVKPTTDNPGKDGMKNKCENELYFIAFEDYPKFCDRKPIKDIGKLLRCISEATNFLELKAKTVEAPVKAELYKEFLASLENRIEPIRKLRNCLAHNRAIPQSTYNDYQEARPKLLESLTAFFEAVNAVE